jgi:hypothetical protein
MTFRPSGEKFFVSRTPWDTGTEGSRILKKEGYLYNQVEWYREGLNFRLQES